MTQLQSFFTSYKTLMGFMIFCIVVQMALGDKFLQSFLTLVLCSMIVINGDKFTKWLSNVIG